MINKFISIFIIGIIFISCSKEEIIDKNNDRLPVLSYDAEISETLSLDINNIILDEPKNFSFWSQHFQNPSNNLNNILTDATFESKSKIITGRRGPVNIVITKYATF